MYYVLVKHEVENYKAWKSIFDAASTIRKEAGELSFQVLKYQNDSNKIVHFSKWSSLEDAKLFFNSSKLVKIRAEAGVKSPEFFYLDLLEMGQL